LKGAYQMKTQITLEWLIAAGTRALKTFAQTALGMFTVGGVMRDIQWTVILSTAAVSAIYSIFTSVATGLPEVGTDGTLQIDTSSEAKDVYRFILDIPLDTLAAKNFVKLSVDSKADLSQK